MSFLDELSDYLRQIELQGEKKAIAPSHEIDPAFARNALIHCLERLDARPPPEDAFAALIQSNPAQLLSIWQRNDSILSFASQMSRLLRESIWKNASDEEIHTLIEVAVARRLGLPDKLQSRIRTTELDRIAEEAYGVAFKFKVQQPVDNSAYSEAIRATRQMGTDPRLTAVGRVFLELKGRDAIRWLLHVEAAQSFGPSDPWRVSRETAAHLVQKGSWSFHVADEEEAGFHHDWKSMRRLAALGIVKIAESDDGLYTDLDVLPVGRQLLAEIADERATPMSVLADSILSDLTLSAANTAVSNTEKTTASVESTAVAESNVRQSRLVAHEIRNMLVPVKTALGALYREVQMAEHPGDVVARRRDSIDRGIDSVFRFIGQLVELSQFAATPPEPFDVLMAIRDAASLVESETGQRIDRSLPAQLPPVSGHRARVVTALTNILRNATQVVSSTAPMLRIEAESIEGASAVRLVVDDNGPGVPENMRRAIFDEGVSLRGGTGLGLALVREVFEREMRGLVACEASPLGGARFVVRLPATGTERP